MLCDMCGRKEGNFKCLIEGSELEVCKHCSRYGQILENTNKTVKTFNIGKSKPSYVTVKDSSELLRKKRELLGLKQNEVANKLNIKESLYHKIERGTMELDLELARKLEKFFNLSLITEYKEFEIKTNSESSKGFVLGDLIKRKL